MNTNLFKTNDLNYAAFLKTRGWHIATVAGEEIKEIIFQIPGWDTEAEAKSNFIADAPGPSKSLLRNYHYVKNLVTRRKRVP